MAIIVPLPIQIATIISCIGSFFTLFTYILFIELRTPSQIFAIWLAIGSLGYSIFTYLPMIYRNNFSCKVYGAISTYFTLISLFTTVVVADCMRKIFIQRITQSQELNVYVKKEYYLFVFIFPLTFVWLPATTNSFGINDHDIFCWIETDTSHKLHNDLGFMWILLTFYFPFFCGIIYNTYVYASVIYWAIIWKKNNAVEANRLMTVVDRIKWYPIILIVCYTVPFFHRGMEMYSDDFKHHHKIVIISAVTLKLQGFFDALAYSATPQVLRRWQFFIYDNFIPTIEWVSYSNQTVSTVGGVGVHDASGMIIGRDFNQSTHTTSPMTKNISPNSSSKYNTSNSNSNSKGSSYFSYAQDESDCNP